MIIDERLRKELLNLKDTINTIANNNSISDLQIESFLRNFEQSRYNLLMQIKLYNENTNFEYERISTIDNEYKATVKNNVLKIYIPELLPSFKNVKTHTHKRILLNIIEATKPFLGLFENKVFIYIKIYNNILGWDVDNRYIKPIADALTHGNIIKDDNFEKMSYGVKGEYSNNPHTEVYVFDGEDIDQLLLQYSI
ncbi:MAG: hypothetical protein HFJ52_01705 [Clostridia bacterium]|nr:hypothetical protein [Clostridia bacterium]